VDNSTAAQSLALVTPEVAVHSTQNPTGKLSLTGMQHLVMSPAGTDQWWAPGLCGESRLSSSDWCEACDPAQGRCKTACTPGFGFWEDGYIDCPRYSWGSNATNKTISIDTDHHFGGHGFSAKFDQEKQCVDVANQGKGTHQICIHI
jgi:hypothetical protein